MDSQIKIDDEIVRAFSEYTVSLRDKLRKITRKKANELAEMIKADSPRRTKSEKHYADSWRVSSDYEANGYEMSTSYTIHNDKYQLTHLLEYGHMNRDGSRTAGIPHIEANTEKIQEELKEEIERAINEAG